MAVLLKSLAVLLAASTLDAQLSPRPPRVEVDCPAPPASAIVDGRRVLVYELHVTNLGRGALGFRELDVRARASAAGIATYTDSALTALLMMQHGMMQHDMRSETVTRLDPWQRAVLFMWVAVPSGASPRVLSHRFVFDNLDSAEARRDGGIQAVLDNIDVPVVRTEPALVRPPVSGGDWLAGDGPSNTSAHRRSLNAVDGHGYLSQRFAIDWVKVGPNGNTFQGDEHKNESYWGFGQPVLAVADGEVVAVSDTIQDHAPHGPIPPVTLANIMGNYVILKLGPGRYATYAHLRHGSIHVRVNQHVSSGTALASLGNTGQSTGPHLHFQITDRPDVLASEGIPYLFASFHLLGRAETFEESAHGDERRRNELPAENMVVSFPPGH